MNNSDQLPRFFALNCSLFIIAKFAAEALGLRRAAGKSLGYSIIDDVVSLMNINLIHGYIWIHGDGIWGKMGKSE